jgi:hypothetical protein
MRVATERFYNLDVPARLVNNSCGNPVVNEGGKLLYAARGSKKNRGLTARCM